MRADRTTDRPGTSIASVAALVAATLLLLTGCGGDESASTAPPPPSTAARAPTPLEPPTPALDEPLADDDASLPAAPASALAVPAPRRLGKGEAAYRWASVLRPVTARAAPAEDAGAVAEIGMQTPEETSNLVLVLGQRPGADGALWVQIRLPVLPNNTTGWVPRESIGAYNFVRTRLVVDVERFRATLYEDGRQVFRAPVGVGLPRWPTPTGEFYIRNELTSYSSPVYGPLAFGTSARSAVLTDWPDGGFVGIHGTNEPELLPGRVSHGCIRMRNEDILELARLMPVGTPLTVA